MKIQPMIIQGGTAAKRESEALSKAASATGIRQEALMHHPDAKVVSEDTIDAVRESSSWLGDMPSSADRRVVVFLSPHTMKAAAANAMLKTLEEPPGESVIILCAPHVGSLLPTIASRCRTVTLPWPDRPSGNDMADTLWKQCEDFARMADPTLMSTLLKEKLDRETASSCISLLRNRVVGMAASLSGTDLENASRATSKALSRVAAGVAPALAVMDMCIDLSRSGCLLGGGGR